MVNSALDSDIAAYMAGRGSAGWRHALQAKAATSKEHAGMDSDRLHAVSSARQELGDLDPPVSKPPVRVN
jgi:hypothetical protein